MKSFYHYLAESVKEYRFRIKSLAPIDDHFIKLVDQTLFKYGVKNISKPKKLMPQKAPLDFREKELAEIHIIDVVLETPASSFVLATDLRAALKLLDTQLVVRGENEPRELEASAIEEIQKDSESKAKLNDPMYEDEDQPAEVAFGDEYNKKLLDYLAQGRANSDTDVPAIEEIKKVAKFSWLNPKDKNIADDFNSEIDTVKPVHVNSKTPGKEPSKATMAGHLGNYTDAVMKKKS